jgi:hypothetical protein
LEWLSVSSDVLSLPSIGAFSQSEAQDPSCRLETELFGKSSPIHLPEKVDNGTLPLPPILTFSSDPDASEASSLFALLIMQVLTNETEKFKWDDSGIRDSVNAANKINGKVHLLFLADSCRLPPICNFCNYHPPKP